MVNLTDIPGLPAWDQRAADELVATTETMRRILEDLWPRLDSARWQATANWTGRSSAAFDGRFHEIEQLVARLRAELEAASARVAGGARAADDERRRWALYQVNPGLGAVHDLLDWLDG